jgi:glucose/arabinose dehydrogenase
LSVAISAWHSKGEITRIASQSLRHETSCENIKNAAVAALALLLILPAMGYAQVSPSPSPNIQLTAVITGISNPVAITNAGDGSGRLFVTLQGGRILVYDGVQLLQEPFLDISSLITSGGERGLLSVAFHPNYLQNGFLYVNYTDLNGDTVVARYTVSADTNRVDAASALILLQVLQPFTNHNGGQLKFGPDGYLYIGMGDGGSGGDPLNHAQTLNSLLGKMLRIDVDAAAPTRSRPTTPLWVWRTQDLKSGLSGFETPGVSPLTG